MRANGTQRMRQREDANTQRTWMQYSQPVAIRWILLLYTVGQCTTLAMGQPYRTVPVDELFVPQSQITITSPAQMSGVITYTYSSDAGESFFATAEDDFTIEAKIILPHSTDLELDPYGCTPYTKVVNDEGDTFAGNFLLVQRGTCSFSTKFVAASGLGLRGVLLIGCQPGSACDPDPTLFTMAMFDQFTVPAVYIASADGTFLRNYLNLRRSIFINTRDHALPHPPDVVCLNATLSPCLIEPLKGSLIGTGPLIDPAERQALVNFGSLFQWDGRPFLLPSWNEFRTNSSLDPCYPRGIVGVYCERGRIVSVNLSVFNVSGSFGQILPGMLDSWTALKYLILASNAFSGSIPEAFCALKNLRAVQLDGNSFTHLPDCLGGGLGLASPNRMYDGWQQLEYFGAKDNMITNFPSSFVNLTGTLRALLLSRNQIDANFPVELLSKGTLLERMELYGNSQLILDFDAHPNVTFSSLQNAFSILLRDSGLKGSLPQGAFDGLGNLRTLDLRNNALTGPLPNFVGCKQLEILILSNNQFQGGIPLVWAENLENSLTDLFLDQNEVSQPLDTLKSLTSLQRLYASHNSITSLNGDSGVPDIGVTIWSLTPPNLQELYLDHNLLQGQWLEGWIPTSLLKLSIAYNSLLQFPPDLWSNSVVIPYMDLSFCSLQGGLPLTSPPLNLDPITGVRGIERLKLEGNPQLHSWPLPSWIKQSSSIPLEYVLDSSGGPFQCLKLVTVVPTVDVSVDPTFTNYQGCICKTGTFGVPPKCYKLPQLAEILPFQVPISPEIGVDFSQIIEAPWNDTMQQVQEDQATLLASNNGLGSMIFGSVTNEGTAILGTTSSTPHRKLQSSSSPDSLLSSYTFQLHPPGFTDAWYGSDRFTSGMSTRWTVDLRHMYVRETDLSTQQQTQSANSDGQDFPPPVEVQIYNSTSASDTLDPTGAIILASGTVLQPVRVVTVRLHISLSVFSSNCNLGVYEGDAELKQTRVWALSGTDQQTLNGLPRSTPFTSTQEYQATYADSLSLLTGPVGIAEIPVFQRLATIDFATRNPNGTHFVATYSSAFRCPQGYEVSEDTSQCSIPTLGNARSALVVGLIVAAVLCLLVCLWMMWERYQRQHVHQQLLRKDRRASLFGRPGANKNGDAQATDKPSDVDLDHESERLHISLRSQSHRSLLKELLFELWTLFSSIVSSVLNWLVVGQVLAAGTSSLTSESVAYISIVVVSTFAFGAISVSRVFVLIALRAQLLKELMKSKQDDASAVAGTSWQTMTEKQAKFDLELLDRRITRHGMTALSLLLNAVPFIVLNLLTLIERDSLHGRSNLILLISLLVNVLLLGSKLQELKDYPTHRIQRTQMRIRLIEIEKGKMDEQDHPENGASKPNGADVISSHPSDLNHHDGHANDIELSAIHAQQTTPTEET